MRVIRSCDNVTAGTTVEDVTNTALEATEHLQEAYDILNSVGDYADSLIDWTLVDELGELIRNLSDAFGF